MTRMWMDQGGTFTDIVRVHDDGRIEVEKALSNQSMVTKDLEDCSAVRRGTTVATNTVLTNAGAKVGLITTKGFGQVLQIARSFVPGGLGGWVIFNKTDPLAPLECTIEAEERVGTKGDIVSPIDLDDLEEKLKKT